jgi:hypothetical protein
MTVLRRSHSARNLAILVVLISSSFNVQRSSFTVAQQPATTQSSDEIAALITQLSADNWKQREAAQERLVLLGEEARQRLVRAAQETNDDETRSRAEAAIVQIDQNAATGPSIITLHLRDVPPQVIFEKLSQQCRAALDPFTPDFWQQKQWPAVDSIDIDHQPFWAAMKQISAKTGVELRQWDTGLKLVAASGQNMGPEVVSGPFLIIANRIARNESIDLGGARTASSDFAIALTAFAEPKLRLLRAGYVARVDEAIDDNGNSLLPERAADIGNGYTTASGGMWSFQIKLAYPQHDPGKRIVRLKGAIDVALQTRFQTLEIGDITSARNVSKTAGGVRAVVQELKRNGEQYELSMTIYPDGFAPRDWERVQQSLVTADLRLIDDHGVAFMRSGCSTSGGNDRLEATMQFVKNPWVNAAGRAMSEPSKLLWNIPTESKETSVPFEFTDLPIP